MKKIEIMVFPGSPPYERERVTGHVFHGARTTGKNPFRGASLTRLPYNQGGELSTQKQMRNI